MLLVVRVAAYCCCCLLGLKGIRPIIIGWPNLAFALQYYIRTYVHVVRGCTFMPPPSQPTALPAEVRAPLCHIAKKRVIVPSAYCVALRRKALNHATKGAAAATTADEAPYLLNAAAQRRKARRGVAWPSMRRLRGNEKCGSFHLRRERLIYISRSLPHTLLNTRYVR